MSNLSTTDETNEIATCGVRRESIPLHSAGSELLESSSEEEGEIREDPEPRKRRHSPEEQSPAKRIRGPEPNAFNFSDILHVRSRLNCMIGVNDMNPFGAFNSITEGWMIRMFIDPGRFGSPSITLGFSKDDGKDSCRSTWDVDTYVQGEWAMDDITFSRLQDQDPGNFDRPNYRAFMACETNERHLLFSMKFRSWKRVIGYDHLPRKESAQMPKNSRRSMRAIFNPDDSYTLTIWFKAPYDVVQFQRNCLGLFTRALAARKPPLYGFIDDSGEQFAISRNMGRRKYLASTDDQSLLAPKASAASGFREESEPDESMSSTGDTTEVEPTRQSPDLGLQAPQPTSGLRPGLTGEFPMDERDMEIRRQRETPTYTQPLQGGSRRASVDRGSEEAPAMSRTPKDISPNRTAESDIGLRSDVPLLDLESEDFNVMDPSATSPGMNPGLDPHPEPHFSPNDRSPPLMADRGSEADLLDLETRAIGSGIPEDQTGLTLTTERSSSTPPHEATNITRSFTFMSEPLAPPREYNGIVPSFLFGSYMDDESKEGNGGGSGE